MNVDRVAIAATSPNTSAPPPHQVDELDRAERQVGPLEHSLQRPPVLPVRERLLGRAEEAREQREPLAVLLALDPCVRLVDVRCEPLAQPLATRRREGERPGEEHEQADEQRHHRRAGAVEALGEQGALRGVADSGDRERRARLARRGQRRKLKLLAGTRRGRVLDAPRALELRARCWRRSRPAPGSSRPRGRSRRWRGRASSAERG